MSDDEFNDLIVVKRSGQRVLFNSLKIAVAIRLAFNNYNSKYNEKDSYKVYTHTINYIKDNYVDRKTINVENIQDIIESILKSDNYMDVYEVFSEYRKRRTESRKAFSLKQQHKLVKVIEKISSLDSSNKTPTELLNTLGESISSEYTNSYIVDNKLVRANEEGKIYIHNFSYFNLGFINDTHLIVSNTLKNDNCFFELLNLLLEAKLEIQGEISINDFDILLEEYILKTFKVVFENNLKNYLNLYGYLEFIDFKKIKDKIDKINSIEEKLNIFDNMQSISILNNAYNDSINYVSITIHNNIKKLFEFLNNNHKNNKNYSISIGLGNTKESKIVQNSVYKELMNSQDFENITLIYKVKDSTLLSNIEDLIMNEKNIKINFVSKSPSGYFSSGLKVFDENSNSCDGRMNIANSSLNIARLGMKYKNLNKEFFSELDDMLELTKNELLFVFEHIGDKSKENYQIIFNNNILDDEKLEEKQKVRKIIKNGTLNINLIGIKECAIIIDQNNYQNLILKLIKYIKEKINCFTKESKLNFTLSVLNYKNASTSLTAIDKTIFGIIPNITDKVCYSDTFKINCNNFENLEFISKCQKLLNGGSVLKVTIPKNISIKKISEILKSLEKNNIEFASIRKNGD